MTTTPLPPSSLFPKYRRIEDLIEHVWERSLEIEELYYKTANDNLIEVFAMNVVIIQFWETVHMRIQEEQSRSNDKKR